MSKVRSPRTTIPRPDESPIATQSTASHHQSVLIKTRLYNPRSTVATVTEIMDYLRLLWARLAVHIALNVASKLQGEQFTNRG